MCINVLHKSHVAILRPTTSKVMIDGQDYFSKNSILSGKCCNVICVCVCDSMSHDLITLH